MLNKPSTRQAVIESLRKAQKALDAYEVAKNTGLSPIQACRTLRKLVSDHLVGSDNHEDELLARYSLL